MGGTQTAHQTDGAPAGADTFRPRHPAWAFKPLAATRTRKAAAGGALLELDLNLGRQPLALKPRARTGFVKFSCSRCALRCLCPCHHMLTGVVQLIVQEGYAALV